MKKLPCNIGSFTLRNVDLSIQGMEGPGFKADISKGTKIFGYLEDWGDGGGVSVTIKKDEASEKLAKNCLKNFKLILKKIAEPNSLILPYNGKEPNEYYAIKYIAELLLSLYQKKQYVDEVRRQNKNTETILISTGRSWFNDYPKDIPMNKSKRISYSLPAKFVMVDQEKKMEYIGKDFKEHKPMIQQIETMQFIPNGGKGAWDFTIEGFCDLFRNGRKFEKLLKEKK